MMSDTPENDRVGHLTPTHSCASKSIHLHECCRDLPTWFTTLPHTRTPTHIQNNYNMCIKLCPDNKEVFTKEKIVEKLIVQADLKKK